MKKNPNSIKYVGWEITSKCNLKCLFCYSFVDYDYLECTLSQIQHGLKNLKSSGVKAINIGGGEPLLRKDIFQILKAAKEQKLKVFLSTNGMLINSVVLEKLNKYIDWLCLSLDSSEKSINDKFRGKGHFNKITALLKKLQKQPHNFQIKINTIVYKENFSSIIPIGRLIEKVADKWKLMQFKPRNRGSNNKNRFLINRNNFSNLVNQVKKTYKKKLDITKSEYDPNEEYEFIIIRPDGFCMVPKGNKYIPFTSVFDKKLRKKINKISKNPQHFFKENNNLLEQSYNTS